MSRTFFALCGRDLWVTVRHETVSFLAQALLQPLFFLFVFGRVLPEIGAAQGAYGTQLLPGIVAITLMLTALQNTALPLIIEFSFTKEIEDRLLAPLPVWAVAVQKLLIASLRAIFAALLILPFGALILPGGIDFSDTDWAAFALVLIAGSLAGAGVGLVMGTGVPPNRISTTFSIVLTPLVFTGSTFYPWAALDKIPVFQVITLFNPLTYLSEASRAAITDGPHLATGWIVLGLTVSVLGFCGVGIALFERRAVD
jgi:ABC-2 type transport system permease protein